jgi:hypothetical protein
MKKLYQYSASLAAKKLSTFSISPIRAERNVSSEVELRCSSEFFRRMDFISFFSLCCEKKCHERKSDEFERRKTL